MPVYAKKTTSEAQIFKGRAVVVAGASQGVMEASRIPVPDALVLCNGCNEQIETGYLIYLGKREMARNEPYDVYCEQCLKRSFPKAIIVEPDAKEAA